jgi:hypothetical protein
MPGVLGAEGGTVAATAAGELEGVGCTCRRGRREGNAATGDTAASEPAVSKDGTGKTVAEDKREDDAVIGSSRPRAQG